MKNTVKLAQRSCFAGLAVTVLFASGYNVGVIVASGHFEGCQSLMIFVSVCTLSLLICFSPFLVSLV